MAGTSSELPRSVGYQRRKHHEASQIVTNPFKEYGQNRRSMGNDWGHVKPPRGPIPPAPPINTPKPQSPPKNSGSNNGSGGRTNDHERRGGARHKHHRGEMGKVLPALEM